MKFHEGLMRSVKIAAERLIKKGKFPSADAINREGIKISLLTIAKVRHTLEERELLIIPDRVWENCHSHRKKTMTNLEKLRHESHRLPGPNDVIETEEDIAEKKRKFSKEAVRAYKAAWKSIIAGFNKDDEIARLNQLTQERMERQLTG